MFYWAMVTYANGEPILEGDWIRVWVPKLAVWHHGIVRTVVFISPGIVGIYVVHNRKVTGITTTDVAEFAEGQPVFLYRRPAPNQVLAILARADASIGKHYNLFGQNCEHFASFAFNGRAESTSMRALGALALAGIVVAVMNS